MTRALTGILLLVGALAAQAMPARGQTAAEADVAWRRGDTETADRLYSSRIAADSSDVVALHRVALIRAWSEKYDQSLTLFDRLLRVAPDNIEAAVDRARVLAWSGDTRAAIAALDEILTRNPRNRLALQARAQFTSWSGRYGESVATYNKLLEETPGDPEALRGLARVASWRGDLAEGERRWRKVLAVSPDDVAALVGLAAVLRWQGRDAAALPLLEEAIRLSPRDRDARTQLEWVRAAVAPRATPSLVYETDSDGNRIRTTSLVGAWRPAPRLEIRGEGYLRRAEQTGAESFAQQGSGALISAWRQWEPGWALTLGVGVRLSDTPGADPLPSARAVLTTPARNAGAGSVAFNRNALDATAALLRNRVSVDELAASASTTLGAGWNLSGGASAAVYDGRETNIRTGGYASLARRMLPRVTLGVAARAFGFEKDLNEGYFDPDFYGIAEITASVYREVRKWNLGTEIAPGLQQVGSNGKRTGAFRATGRIGYTVAPGRQVGVSAGLSNSGLHQLSPGSDADYRYRAFSVSGGWRF